MLLNIGKAELSELIESLEEDDYSKCLHELPKDIRDKIVGFTEPLVIWDRLLPEQRKYSLEVILVQMTDGKAMQLAWDIEVMQQELEDIIGTREYDGSRLPKFGDEDG